MHLCDGETDTGEQLLWNSDVCLGSPFDAVDGSPVPRELRLLAELEEAMGQVVTIGLDIAKSVFQVHGIDAEGGRFAPSAQTSLPRESRPHMTQSGHRGRHTRSLAA